MGHRNIEGRAMLESNKSDLSPSGYGQGRLRLGILATPRSGNTWLRNLLGSVYGLADVVCDQPDEVPWSDLPDRCVLQLHWGPEPGLIENLRDYDVQALTIARHPLDVLISVLHFSTTWARTSLWFGGRCGSEDPIRGATPGSHEFLDYSAGPRAQALLSISRDWWSVPSCRKLRYETLVSDPQTVLHDLAGSLEQTSADAIRCAVRENTLDCLRSRVQNQHFWHGTPGHWKRLLPAPVARRIADAHKTVFETLEYLCDPDERLTLADADSNWVALEIQTLRQELSRTRTQLLDVAGRLRESEIRLEQAQADVAHLAPLCELGPTTLQFAKGLQSAAVRYPRLHSLAAHWLRPFRRTAG
jgi:hypothetical protein